MSRLTAPLLGDLLPLFAEELDAALRAIWEVDLADQVRFLPIKRLCPCGDESCGSFYTGQRAQTIWRTGRKHLTPRILEGMTYVEVIDGVIVFVGMLDRPHERGILHERFAP